MREHAESSEPPATTPLLLQEAQYLRALLDDCRRCAASVHEHLEAHGVSVDVVFEVDQLRERTHRIDLLLSCVLSDRARRRDAALRRRAGRTPPRSGARSAASSPSHYSLLARKVAERSAATGEHYITRDARRVPRDAARRARRRRGARGARRLLKFAIAAIGARRRSGPASAPALNYAASFVSIQLLHFTVATKQPAMTAPAMADKLADVSSDEAVEGFVDEVAHLIRSQAAGIFGNLLAVMPVVLAAQWLAKAVFGAPLVGDRKAEHVLDALTLLGPTPLYAAFTGVLLFASSLIAGWVENWFVWHRLDSAIAWNPRIVARLGAGPRAALVGVLARPTSPASPRTSRSACMLGMVPPIARFFACRSTCATSRCRPASSSPRSARSGSAIVATRAFWWCVAGIAATGVLNLAVSFFLAFRVALSSRGIRLADRSRIHRAIRARLWHRAAVVPAAAARRRLRDRRPMTPCRNGPR